jgi:signal transduction histidine kinase
MEEKFTIMIVDDREENIISLENVLETENRAFIKATSGNEALKYALKLDIGLILLDVQMPEMDGFEVAKLLQSNPKTKDISIIFVTAINKEEQYVLKGFEQGAVDYLQKPLDINVTKAKVNVFERLYFYQKDLKKTLEEKEKINKQLERFMYVVAHDLKSPLNGVISLLEMLKEEEKVMAVEELTEYMPLLVDATNHLSNMITSILEYSRQSDMQQSDEAVNVQELVEQIAYLLFPPKHMHISIEGTLPTIKTKKLKLQQVFQNLISNAIKYNDKETGEIKVSYENDGGFYKFNISDNGPGIASTDTERIFHLFETSANRSSHESSTGIGLNIMKMLVEEQGGKITVESEPGKGSTFSFQWRK